MEDTTFCESLWNFFCLCGGACWKYVSVIFSKSAYTSVDYVTWIASVAVGTNGVSTISDSIKNIIKGSDRRAYEVFVTHTIDYIAKLSKQTAKCQKQLEKDGEQQAKNLKKEQLNALAKKQGTIEENQKASQRAAAILADLALNSKVKDYKNTFENLNVWSFGVAVISIFVLVFSPQIAAKKIHSFWFLFLFLPQIILLGHLINAFKNKYFPPKYIKLVIATRSNLLQKIWAPIVYEWKIFTYKTEAKEKTTSGAVFEPFEAASSESKK